MMLTCTKDSITVKVHNVLATLFCRDKEAAGVCRLDASQQCSKQTHTWIKTIISAFSDLLTVEVTMDANTAHPRLIISDDMKSVRHNLCIWPGFRSCGRLCYEGAVFVQVWCGDQHQLLPDNQERFDRIICVLGREMISSGKHYWEVRRSPHKNLPSARLSTSGWRNTLFLKRWTLLGRRTGIWAWPENRSTGRGRSQLPRATDTGSSALETSKLVWFPEVSSSFNLMFMIISRKQQPYDSWLAIRFLMSCWLHLFFLSSQKQVRLLHPTLLRRATESPATQDRNICGLWTWTGTLWELCCFLALEGNVKFSISLLSWRSSRCHSTTLMPESTFTHSTTHSVNPSTRSSAPAPTSTGRTTSHWRSLRWTWWSDLLGFYLM